MRYHKIIILLFLITSFLLFSEDVQTFSPTLLKVIHIGDKPGELGQSNSPYGYLPVSILKIGDWNQIVINDYPNERMNFYSYDMQFINSRKTIFTLLKPGKMNIYGDFYFFNDNLVLKASKDSNTIIFMNNWDRGTGPYSKDKLEIRYSNTWNYHDSTILYDNNGESIIIDPNGNILEKELQEKKILEWRELNPFMQVPEKRSKLVEFLEKNHLILIRNRLFKKEYSHWLRDYYNIVFAEKKEMLFQLSKPFTFYGWDIHDNTYLQVDDTYIVLSPAGDIITKFRIKTIDGWSWISLAPNGALYWYDMLDKEYKFYRVKNTWDPISDKELEDWIKEQQRLAIQEWNLKDDNLINNTKTEELSAPTIKTLTTTSTLTEPNDKNAYHPVKAFDNNPETMWIEAAKGSGLGEYLEVELSTPITIDGIQIQPGCFWEEYWKQNNRVRQMTIFFDDEKYILNFQDVMKNQGTMFKQPITFTKARFLIKDVYKTNNWDDTAISDIWFLKDDKPIELGLGEYAGILN